MKKLIESRKEIQRRDDFGLPINPKTGLFDTDVVEIKSMKTKDAKGFVIKSPWFCFYKMEKTDEEED